MARKGKPEPLALPRRRPYRHVMPTDRVLAGLGYRLLAVLLLATMSALIKLAQAQGAHLFEIMFWRQLSAVPLVLGWVAASDGLGSLRTDRFGAHLTRTSVGLVGMFFTFGAVLLLPLAEAQTLAFTVPIFATILGAVVLREATGWHRWGAVIAGFAGVVIVTQPGSGTFPLIGAVVGLIAALFVAVVAILLRSIGRTESPGTTTFYFSALSVPPLAIFYAFNMAPHSPGTWAVMIACGLFGGAGQLAFTAALKYAPVSAVMPMDYSGLVWATLYGWLLFDVLPTPYTWIGAPLIIASGLYIAWREQRLARTRSGLSV